MMEEVTIMIPLRHPNVVQLMGASLNDAANVCVVLEWVEKGDLFSLLNCSYKNNNNNRRSTGASAGVSTGSRRSSIATATATATAKAWTAAIDISKTPVAADNLGVAVDPPIPSTSTDSQTMPTRVSVGSLGLAGMRSSYSERPWPGGGSFGKDTKKENKKEDPAPELSWVDPLHRWMGGWKDGWVGG